MPPGDRTAPTYRRRLENGLTVLVREDHSAEVVAIVTHVKAGYFNEPDRLVGISHVLEHMYFKGTERRGAGDIARETKEVGGYLNAGTIYDYTSYYTVLPSSALEQGLDIQSDALLNSEIDEEELRRELLVIIQEANRKLDNPAAVATESLYEEMFDVHRIRRWRIGTEEGLRRLTRADVWDYYRNLYHPSNVVLVVAGDVEPERAFALVERYYGGMPAGEPVIEKSPPEPERRGLRFREMAGDIVQTHLEWGWRTPGTLHEHTPALDLLAVVLGQGRASRLYRQVRDRGLVSSISAHNYTPTDLGVFGISAELQPEQTLAALHAIHRTVAELAREGPTGTELERARNILEARLLRQAESVEGQAVQLAEWEAVGDWRLADVYLDRIRAATVDELRRVAGEYLDLERATVLAYRPDAAPPLGWDAATLLQMLRGAAPAGMPAATPPAGGTEAPGAAAPVGGVETALGRAMARRGAENGVHFFELEGGSTIVVMPRRESALVAMSIAVAGGSLQETAERTGSTALMARASVRGTTTRDAAQLAEATEALGGVITVSVGSDLLLWSLSVPARHFRAAFPLLADAALRPVFPEGEVERERKVLASDLEQLRDDMYRYPLRLFHEAAFGGHPYGTPLAVAEGALPGLTAGGLRAWHQAHVLGATPWVIVVGGVDPEEVAGTVAHELSGLAATERASFPLPAPWPNGMRERAESRAKAQTALVLGFPGPARNDEDAYAAQVLAAAVSGLGNRLFEELRSRRSLAYTVAAQPVSHWLAGAFIGYIATAPEREEEARRALLEEFDRLAGEGITEAELERARRYLIGAWKIRSQTNGARLADLTAALLIGPGIREIREHEERIRAVTRADVRDLAGRCFDPDRLVVGIVRGGR